MRVERAVGVAASNSARSIASNGSCRSPVTSPSAPGFTEQPAVIDGASRVLVDIFGDAGRHTRSAIGVAALPRGGAVEIELTAAVTER